MTTNDSSLEGFDSLSGEPEDFCSQECYDKEVRFA